MILKAPTVCFTPFILTAVLSITVNSTVFAQGERTENGRQQDTAIQAEALFQHALLLADNDNKSARIQLQEAMRLWMQMREPGKAAMAALQMGDRHKQAKEYRDALNDYRLTLSVNPLPGAVKANALNAIAVIYADLYQNNLAARYFNQALALARMINNLPAWTLALTGLADLYHRQGELEKALTCIAQALQLRKQGQADADADAALLYLKGRVSQQQGSVENARGLFAEALTIYENTGNVAGQVKALCALSTLSLSGSQKQAALQQAEQAAELAEKQAKHAVSVGDHANARELRWRAWLSRARAECALGQKERALISYKKALQHITGLWWGFYIATETSAVAFREETQPAYREYVDLLMEQGEFKQAYERAEDSRARTLLNLTEARRSRPRSADGKEAASLRELSRWAALLRSRLEAAGLSRQQRAKLRQDIEVTEYKIQESRLEDEMDKSKQRLVWSQLAYADQLRQQMAQAQMTLAEFFLGEDRSFVWLFTGDGVFFEILPPRKKIEEAVRAYLSMLAVRPNQLYIERDLAKLREESKELFATLFGRLSSRIEPGQRLIVVPDGLVHYLPFEALIHNGRYLVEDHVISYAPSASMLVQPESSIVEVGTANRMELLAFGDPIFGAEQKALTTKKPGTSPTSPIDVLRNERSSRGFHLSPLPRTRDEVQYIAGLFPVDRTRFYLSKDSTEDAVKRESLRRYRRLHFATHSLIDETSPSRSAVVLTLDTDPAEDGFLEVSEISGLDLDCDLVVLSACQTGRGQLLSGEGIVGLSRAFLYAGARAVVVSLWNVSDISTGQLMESFYRHLANGIGNAAALRDAKLRMLKSDKETRHPYYWSSFVIVGKP